MKIAHFIFFLLLPCFLFAQDDHSLSPYFIISADSSGTLPDFPLQLNAADVSISGTIANVKITQVYINRGKKPLEAIYVFPASTHAAVYAMEMKVGRKNIHAEIREKKQARVEYDSARAQGKTASLLEQERPNVFQMNVANIMPGDSIIVKLFYTELIVPENGIYEFVYPTVVGPRYTGKNDSNDISAKSSTELSRGIPYTLSGTKPDYKFDMHVKMNSPVPFELIESPSHKILLSFAEKNAANILLSPEETAGGNRDFILRYKLSGEAIKTGMMTSESNGEKYFMFMMQPPARIAPDSIPPREYIFVMDVSGSMEGYPIQTSKALLKNLIAGLNSTDLFNVILFAGGSEKFKPVSIPATKENADSAIAFIEKQSAGGGTELQQAMEEAMAIPRAENYSRTIVLATDGYISAEAGVLSSIHNHLDSANVFAFGIGFGVNRYLIEGVAFAGNGEPFVAATSMQADSAAEKFRRYISSPVLTDIQIDFGSFAAYDVDPVHVPDLFAERPIIVTGKFTGKAEGNITVTGMNGSKKYSSVINLKNIANEKNEEALKYLWARQKITLLDYENSFSGNSDSTLIKEITSLGLKYSLLTNYTSFVAVYNKVRNKSGEKDSTVEEPLPLPQGVENSAIGYNLLSVSGLQSMSTVSIAADEISVSYDIATLPVLSFQIYQPLFIDRSCTSISASPVISDWNHFYNGESGNLITHYSSPFFSPQFSSRMAMAVPFSLVSTFSILPGVSGKEFAYLPGKQNDFSFNPGVEHTSLQLSGTSYGLEEMNFNRKGKNKEHWSSSTRYNQRWLGNAADKNHDEFPDVPLQTSVTAMQHFTYYNYEKKISSFANTTVVHGSAFSNGQIHGITNPVSLRDTMLSFMNYSHFTIRLPHYNYLNVEPSFGWAQHSFHCGQNNYFSSSPFAWMKMVVSHNFDKAYLESGITGGFIGAKEKLNGENFGENYFTSAASVRYNYSKEKIYFETSSQFCYDSRYGTCMIPALNFMVNKNYANRIGVMARKVHGQATTFGSLLPLLYSSKQLIFEQTILPDDGWFARLYADFSRSYNSLQFIISAGYNLCWYNRLTLIDLDSDPGKILVYNSGAQPPFHQATLDVELRRNQFSGKIYYAFTEQSFNFHSGTFAAPLLSQHQLSGKLFYETRRENWKFDLTGKYFSAQRIPGHGWSNDFATIDAHASFVYYRWTFDLFALDVLNYKQKTAVYSSSGNFDASQIYAPVIGRIFQVGITYQFREKENSQ